MRRFVCLPVFAAAAVLGSSNSAAAQSFGPFRWQLSPFCNVLTLHVTAVGGNYRLEGFDDQCGGPRAPVIGMAVPNTDGSIGFGLNIVATSDNVPLNLSVSFNPSTFGGTWTDTAGGSGALVFNPAGVSGIPRPAALLLVDGAGVLDGSIGIGDINPTEVQQRVAGVCPAGQFVQSVNQNGTLNCGLDGTGAGDITAVAAGAGLLGGGASGDVSLAVSFAGTGLAPTAARSDHTHQVSANISNTAAGPLAMQAITTGVSNTAFGESALAALTTGILNTAVGRGAMQAATIARQNTAVGTLALSSLSTNALNNTAVGTGALVTSQTGGSNTALGALTLFRNVGGGSNVAVGNQALLQSLGSGNIAVGPDAGAALINGAGNIYIGNSGAEPEDNTIRIGTLQSRAFLAGVRGVTTGASDAIAVFVDSNGQLGTASSSRRFKQDIVDLADIGNKLQQLRPVQFRYREAQADDAHPIQYGLIAEEVDEVLPELVAHSADGQIETVKYHILPTLLIAEVQRLERERAKQAREIAELRALVQSLTDK
jgi:hypothetical protein